MTAANKRTVSLDFQSHLADLEKRGLLIRIDEPINKDTELHPLVRCQFVGGVPEHDRRAFLFTNVVDSTGKKYDMPVAVGALAATPEIYSIGMGCAVGEISGTWVKAIANPIPPKEVTSALCQEVVITGKDLTKPGGGLAMLPVPVSTPGFDAAPTLTATLCITKDPENGIPNMSMNRAALKSTNRLGVRMASRLGRTGGYQHWLRYQKMGKPMPIAIVLGCAPVVVYNGPQRLPTDFDEITVAGALTGAPLEVVRAKTVDLMVPANGEIVIEGLISTELLEPEGPFGESTGYVALEDYNLSMEVTAITHRRSPVFTSIISQVTPSESSVMRKVAMEPVFLTHLRQIGISGIRKVVMHETLSNLRPLTLSSVCAWCEPHRGLARIAGRVFANRRLRKDRDCGQRGCRPQQCQRGVLVDGLSVQSDRGPAGPAVPRARSRSKLRQRFRRAGRSADGKFDAADRCDAQARHAAGRLAGQSLYGARPGFVEQAETTADFVSGALARLSARRLARQLGRVRAECNSGQMGSQRRRHLGAAARRYET